PDIFECCAVTHRRLRTQHVCVFILAGQSVPELCLWLNTLATRVLSVSVDDTVRLVVADNGVGARNAGEGAGLSGLRRRVEGLGGDAQFDRDAGMQIRITLPVTPLLPEGAS
ncbi:MAG: hypothetical protein AAFX85_14840, partial [Pseudomonadota bacterium]